MSKYVWPILAILAGIGLFILGWNWLQRQPTASPAVVPYGTNGQTAPAGQPGAPTNNNEINIDIDITGWLDLNNLCGSGLADCKEDTAGRVFVFARSNGECRRVCKTNQRNPAKPNCVQARNSTAKLPVKHYVYQPRDAQGQPTVIVVNNPGTGGSSTSTGGSPVAYLSTGSISGMRDFSAGFGPMTAYAQAQGPRDTIAYNGPITNNPVNANDNRPQANAVAEASNNQQTTVIEGDTYVEGDRVTIYNDNRVFNTYIMRGDTYVIPATAGPIYIVVGGHLYPASDICAPGGVCEECKRRGDCPPWLTDRCDKECPVGPGPTSIPPTATTGPGTSVPPPTIPPTAGPGPSATPITPVPPTPVPGARCYTKGWNISDRSDTDPYVVVADDSGRIWQPCLEQEDRRSYQEVSITVPGAAKFGQGHWFYGEGTSLFDNSGSLIVSGDFGKCLPKPLVPGGWYKLKQQPNRPGGVDMWLRPECNGGAPIPTQAPKPTAVPDPSDPLPPCGKVNYLSSPGTLQVVEGCDDKGMGLGWIGQDILGELSGDARAALYPVGWDITFTPKRNGTYTFKGVSVCIGPSSITSCDDAGVLYKFGNDGVVTLTKGVAMKVIAPKDRVKNAAFEMFPR